MTTGSKTDASAWERYPKDQDNPKYGRRRVVSRDNSKPTDESPSRLDAYMELD